MKDTVIIGIGNILLKDDGVGVHTVKALENENLPSTIELVDGGTSTLDTLSYFMDYKKGTICNAQRFLHGFFCALALPSSTSQKYK